MLHFTAKARQVDCTPKFDTATDTPLSYFSTEKTFVRSNRKGNYTLYCAQHTVALITYDGFIYTYPSYKPQHEQYVEAFILEYAPHISFDELKPHLGSTYMWYIGKPNQDTLKGELKHDNHKDRLLLKI